MKTNRPLRPILTVMTLLPPLLAVAQTTLYPLAEATIRDGANANVDINEASLGYVMVKYGVGSSAKAYFKFNFTGFIPNTNNALSFTYTTYSASQRQHVQVWALNQPYPDFTNSVLTWNTAQANYTTNNSMLTSGPFTATPLLDFISPSTAGVTRTFAIPGPWGQFLLNNELVLVMTSLNDPTNQANGLRLQTNFSYVMFQQLVGAPPSISPISDLTVMATQMSATNSFSVDDPEDGPNGLMPNAVSSNEAVVPSANVFFGGSGANRSVYVLAGSTAGTANITVSVTDSDGNVAQRTFTVTVVPLNFPPSISTPSPTNTLTNVTVTVPFTVSDPETPAEALTVTGAIAWYSTNVLASLSFGGSGSNRTVQVTPVAGADGVGIVTVQVSDPNNNTSSVSFAVMVLPSTDAVFSDHFDYPDGELFVNAPGFWARRGGVQAVKLKTMSQQAWIRQSSTAESGIGPLAHGPFAVGNRTMLYTVFKATWVDLGQLPLVGTSVGAFLHLYDPGSASVVAAIATTTNDVPEGSFRLRVANGTGYTVYPQDLAINTTYKIVVRYDVDNAQTTLWIDTSPESSPGVTATDSITPVPISHVGLRQNSFMGNIWIDDLQVFAITPPVITAIQVVGSNVEIYFSAGVNDTASNFGILRATDVGGPYTEANPAIVSLGAGVFRATMPVSASRSFYRVKRQFLSF